jgi:hypothetical protein
MGNFVPRHVYSVHTLAVPILSERGASDSDAKYQWKQCHWSSRDWTRYPLTPLTLRLHCTELGIRFNEELAQYCELSAVIPVDKP